MTGKQFREALPDAKGLMNDIIEFGVDIEKKKIPANLEVQKYFIDTIARLGNDALARVLETILGLPKDTLTSSGQTTDTPTETPRTREPEPEPEEHPYGGREPEPPGS